MIYHWFSRNQVPAGTVRRLVVLSPHDANVTWGEIVKTGLPFPPGANFAGEIYASDPNGDRIKVLAVELAPPAVSREFVSSGQPAGAPVGHGGMAPPPEVMVNAPPPQRGRAGSPDYEELGDAALPSGGDAFLGDSPWDGGTYTDVTGDGREVKRGMDESQIPIAPQPVPGSMPPPQ